LSHPAHYCSKTAEAAKKGDSPNDPRSCPCIGISRYDHRTCTACHAL
jgi:hypothetical protein